MPGRGRRIVVVLAAAALVLSLGRWGSTFLAERLWEASISEAAALAGARRALFTLALELAGLLTGVIWCLLNFTAAARVALPDRPAPEADRARVWPSQIPRWALPLAAVVLGILAGAGAGRWHDEILLALDGARMGVPDPLLNVDLGRFLGAIPVRFHLQGAALRLAVLALVGVVGLHLAGGTIRLVDRRLWVSPRARGHLALLLGLLALLLAWGRMLEPYRLAAGDRGPLLPSAFLLNRSVAAVQAGFGAGAAVVSFLWWIRMRGVVAAAIWALFGIGLLAGRLVPLRSSQAVADPDWRAGARRLDSVSFGLGGLEIPPPPGVPAASLAPTLWDLDLLDPALGVDTASALPGAQRSLVDLPGGGTAPVWLTVRTVQGGASLVAVSDAEVSPAGRALSLRYRDSLPVPGEVVYRDLGSAVVRPGALPVRLGPGVPGVPLESWSRRLILAWALQVPGALRAAESVRVGWRLDPVSRLAALAPFAHWEPARPRLVDDEVVWESVGVLATSRFPASMRVPSPGGEAGLVRPSLVGLVWAANGAVRIIRRDPADSAAAAWARIAAPLIEGPGALPAGLRDIGPSETVAAARARALAGPAWSVGRLAVPRADATPAAVPGAGGFTMVHPFLAPQACEIRALLVTRGRAVADSVHLVPVDSVGAIECPLALTQKWERFPFHHQLRDSVQATGSTFRTGQVRYAVTGEGVIAYQPAYAIPQGGGRATLLMVNVALGRRLGAGRTYSEAWRNLRGEISPIAPGASTQAILEAARSWMRHADSALRQGNLYELARALQFLREILEPAVPRPEP